MLTMNGMSGAAVSMVSLAQSRTRPVSRTSSQPPSRPTTPKPSSMRLSAMNMGTVRNAYAGVGAKVSARMSINSASTRSSAGPAAASSTVVSSVGMGTGIGMDGDFMDLRDPFASPPPYKIVSVSRGGDHTGGGGDFWVSERAMSSLGGREGLARYDDDDCGSWDYKTHQQYQRREEEGEYECVGELADTFYYFASTWYCS
jgi:hypothetical protein